MVDSPKPPSWFLVVRQDGEVVCGCGNEASAVSMAAAFNADVNPTRVVPVWERDPAGDSAFARVYAQKVDAILTRVGNIESYVRLLRDFVNRVQCGLSRFSCVNDDDRYDYPDA